MNPCCARCRRGMPGMGGSCGQPTCPCHQKDVCTCTPISNPWTYYGIVEPGGALEPDMDCPVHFPLEASTRKCHALVPQFDGERLTDLLTYEHPSTNPDPAERRTAHE